MIVREVSDSSSLQVLMPSSLSLHHSLPIHPQNMKSLRWRLQVRGGHALLAILTRTKQWLGRHWRQALFRIKQSNWSEWRSWNAIESMESYESTSNRTDSAKTLRIQFQSHSIQILCWWWTCHSDSPPLTLVFKSWMTNKITVPIPSLQILFRFFSLSFPSIKA